MKIKKYRELNEGVDRKKFYVFSVNADDRTYRGSIWDSPVKPWVPYGSELLTEFELDGNKSYMVVNQEDLDEINKIKEENEIKRKSKKYNL